MPELSELLKKKQKKPMNIKKYRASTTREALEKIKQDLGEDAFVLETKQINTKGFLGFGSEKQIEVSATMPPETDNPKKNKLNLTEETIAEPNSPKPSKISRNDSILNLRSHSSAHDKVEEVEQSTPQALQFDSPSKQNIIEPVEISSKKPKLVHQKAEASKKKVEDEDSSFSPIPAKSKPVVSSRELELLRAEIREVKYSIGAFASRQNLHPAHGDFNMEDYAEVFDSPFYDSYLELCAAGIKPELARRQLAEIIPIFKEELIAPDKILSTALLNIFTSKLTFESDPLNIEASAILAVIGATGVGKTTTIAKLAAKVALRECRRVDLVTLDTYRIAAVEQLKTYAEIIGARCHVVRSVFELDAVLTRIPKDSTVLIDTTGKNPHDLADQYEVSEYMRKRKDIRKCLAVQADIHPLDGIAAMKKFEMFGTDCVALTKLDETTRPAALIETLNEAALPLAYLCMGQRVPEDLRSATPESMLSQIVREPISVSYANA